MSIIGWSKIYDNTLSSAATSVTISGLHGDVDLEYKLEARIVNGYNGAVSCYVRPNNNSSGSNFGFQGLYGANTSAAAIRATSAGWDCGYLNALAEVTQQSLTISSKSGYVRTCIKEQLGYTATTTVANVDLKGQSWNNTADEITSLVVLADQTNGLGIGTQITLWGRATLDYGLQALSEATIKTQGSYSLKCVTDGTMVNKTLTRTLTTPIDLTGKDTLKFDIRSSRTGANLKIGLHSGTTTTELTPTIASANVFQTVTWDISAVDDADKNAVDEIIITVVNDDSANTFYIDNFYTYPITIGWVTP